MGAELELKYAVDDLQLLDCILCDACVTEKMTERYRYLDMKTTYFDTEDGALGAKRWMLRLRKENDENIITCKTPGDGKTRGEWEVHSEYLDEALPQLAAQGAPAELAKLDPETLTAAASAEFKRIAAELQFADGSRCEIAGDIGTLRGRKAALPFCELELERKAGSEQAMLQLGKELEQRYGIRIEPRSKFARAREL